MKTIIITESQFNKLVDEAVALPDKEIAKRLEKAKRVAVNFPNPRQFALRYPKLWNFLRGQKLVDKVFPDRHVYKPDGYWDAQTIAQEAEKYDSRSDFMRGNQFAYNKARKLGILDDLFSFKSKVGRNKVYDDDKSVEVAKNFEGSRSEFMRKFPVAYRNLKDRNIIHRFFSDLRKSDVTDEDLIAMAKQYDNIVDLRKNNRKLYSDLYQRSLLDNLFPTKYREQKLIDVAKQYSSRYELKRNNRRIYRKLNDLGMLDDIFPLTPEEKSKELLWKSLRDKQEPEPEPVAEPTPEPKTTLVKNNKLSSHLVTVASQYDSFDDFAKDFPNLANILKDNKSLLNKFFPKPRTADKLIAAAKKFPTRFELKRNNKRVYDELDAMGVLDDIFPPKPVEKLSLGDIAKDI